MEKNMKKEKKIEQFKIDLLYKYLEKEQYKRQDLLENSRERRLSNREKTK
jgi:hypothetical protein